MLTRAASFSHSFSASALRCTFFPSCDNAHKRHVGLPAAACKACTFSAGVGAWEVREREGEREVRIGARREGCCVSALPFSTPLARRVFF